MNIPWKEHATLVRVAGADQTDGQSEILFEGPLFSLVQKVQQMKPIARRGLRLSMPDRQVRPFGFQDEALTALIEQIPRLGF